MGGDGDDIGDGLLIGGACDVFCDDGDHGANEHDDCDCGGDGALIRGIFHWP